MEVLRAHHCVTWGELAGVLGISRSMLDFVRNGAREPGPKVLRKIIAAEIAAGLVPPAPSEAMAIASDVGVLKADAPLGDRIENARLERKIDELTRIVEAMQKDVSELRTRRKQ
ncbi:MAG: hypothetical protein KJ579_05675 [Verrucomicrobia bacterium]|nr:hypothetical protein [Verrucomicrobiota bacterium]